MNITIAKHGQVRKEPVYTVYVGRTRSVGKQYPHALHALANDHRIGTDCTRAQSVQKYRRNLWNEIQKSRASGVPTKVVKALGWLLEHHDKHGKLTLVCHCHPLLCHCDILKSCLEWMNSKEETNAQNSQRGSVESPHSTGDVGCDYK